VPRDVVNGGYVVSVVGDDALDDALVALIERAALSVLHRQAVRPPVELTVALVSSQEIRELNRVYRRVDAETDVLSFGTADDQAFPGLVNPARHLGDIAICATRAEAQAMEYGHSVAREFAYLTVHGVLHLLGFDHHQPDEQGRMRRAEEEALQRIGLVRSGEKHGPEGEEVYSSHHTVQQKG
jgi:probable rRNA maturation factor